MWLRDLIDKKFSARRSAALSGSRLSTRGARARSLRLEPLEERRLLATYGWDGAGNLAITLAANEDLTITEAAGIRSFGIDTGTFTATNVPATGEGSATISFTGANNISTSVTVDNVGAAPGTNNVTFAGGTLTSATISIAATQGGTTSAIPVTGATTLQGNVSLTSNGADIGNVGGSLGVTGTLGLTAGANSINLNLAANDFGGAVSINSANIATIDDADDITFGAVSTTASLNVDSAGGVNFTGITTVGTTLDVDTNANGGTGGLIQDTGAGRLAVSTSTTLDSGNFAITLNNVLGDLGSSITTDSTSAVYMLDANGLTSVDIDAGPANVTLKSGGAITDGDGSVDFVANQLLVEGTGNVGTAGVPLHTNVAVLDVYNSASGGIYITDTAGGLNLSNIAGGISANAVGGVGGGGQIRANSPLTISSNAITSGGMTYTAGDSIALTGDKLDISAGVTVRDTTAGLVLAGGDAVNVLAGATVNAATMLTINVDPVAGDPDASGGTVTIDPTASIITTTGTTANGGNHPDTFNLPPTSTTSYSVNGGAPAFYTAPGDTLDYRSATNATLTITGPGAGTISKGGVQDVTFTSIEHPMNSLAGSFDLVVDADADPGPGAADDGTADSFLVNLDGAGNLAISVGPAGSEVLVFSGAVAAINTVTVNGSTDDDTLTMDHTNGVIALPGIITFDGSPGAPNVGTGDLLVLEGNPGVGIIRETGLVYGPDSGAIVFDPNGSAGANLSGPFNGDEEFIQYFGLSPVFDTVPVVQENFFATAGIDLIDVIDGPVSPGGFQTLEVNAPTFEAQRFANKTLLTINALDGADAFNVDYSATIAGIVNLELYGNELTDGVLNTDDGARDVYTIKKTSAAITLTEMAGQGGNDVFHNVNGLAPGLYDMSGILGPIEIIGGENLETSGDFVALSDRIAAAAVTLGTLNATTVIGVAPTTITYGGVEDFFLELSGLNDTLDVIATAAGTAYVLAGDGGSDTITIGNQSADFGSTFDGTLAAIAGPIAVLPDSGGTTIGTNDRINIDATGDAALAGTPASITNTGAGTITFPVGSTITGNRTTLAGFAPADISYFHSATGGSAGLGAADNRLEHLAVLASTGADTINVNDTTATVDTALSSYAGDDAATVTINGDGLSADNYFFGFSGTDRFVLNVTADLGASSVFPLTMLSIDGEDPDGSVTTTRDVLEINDNSGAARDLVFDYDPGATGEGDVDINPVGGAGFAIPVNVRKMETLIYNGTGAGDTIEVRGTAGDDDLTVAPIDADEALVFIGGDPWDGPSEGDFFDNFPGIAGGSNGPDMRLNGLDTTAGITFDGEDSAANDGDQLYVYGFSEMDLTDGTGVDPFDPFGLSTPSGFGAGVLMPGLGAGNAFDTIYASDSRVRVTNSLLGPMVPVNINTASFKQAATVNDPGADVPGVIVNAGFEDRANLPVTPIIDVADDILALMSFELALQINGGDPDPIPVGDTVPPDGDRLQVFSPGEINIFSDKGAPQVVTFTSTNPFTAQPSFDLGYSSIESAILTPGPTSQTVNLIGDNNDIGVDQNDRYVIVGQDVDSTLPGLSSVFTNPPYAPIDPRFEPDPDGDNEFTLDINSSMTNPGLYIGFRNVAFLNGFGDDQNPPPGVPSAGPDDIDTLDVTPYADDTPTGWGIDVSFDEGNPDLDGDTVPDLVIYNGVPGVSEEIIVAPSGPGTGQIIVNNASTHTPIVVIDYTTNTGIAINGNDGSAGDTDVLILRGTDGTTSVGTSGHEQVLVDFDAAGTTADPIVQVSDVLVPGPLGILYQIVGMTNIETVNFDLDDGDDFIEVKGEDLAPATTQGFRGVSAINVFGGGGTDALMVDVAGRDLIHSARITFDGGTGYDQLFTTGAPVDGAGAALTVDFTVYKPGPDVGAGLIEFHDTAHGAQPNMTIDFVDLEPVVDTIPADTLVVNGNAADNAINYTVGAVPANGLVTVDDLESIEFSNKTALWINGGSGDDVINLNNGLNTPTGLVDIFVDGGDPTASDTVIVNGTAGTDQIVYTPTPGTEDEATVTGAQPVPVNIATAELVIIDGQGGNDRLTVRSVADSDDVITYQVDTLLRQPGDAGFIDVFEGFSGVNMLPLQFENLDMSGEVVVDNPDGAGIDSDWLVFVTTLFDDEITVLPDARIAPDYDDVVQDFYGLPVYTDNVDSLKIHSMAGDDQITVVKNRLNAGAAPIELRFNEIDLHAGEPDASDVLFLQNLLPANYEVFHEIPLFNDRIVVATDPSVVLATANTPTNVILSGTEDVVIAALSNDDSLQVYGSAAEDDTLTYRPLAGAVSGTPSQSGTFWFDNSNTVYSFVSMDDGNPATDDFIVWGSPTGTNGVFDDLADRLIVQTSNNHDVVFVDAPNRIVTAENPSGTLFKAVKLGQEPAPATVDDLDKEIELLTIETGLGSDTILVVPAVESYDRTFPGLTPGVLPFNLLIDVDGGEPSATDALVIASSVAGADIPDTDFVIINHSRRADEGVVRIFRDATGVVGDEVDPAAITPPILLPDIAFTNIEIVSPVFPSTLPGGALNQPNLLILGPDMYEQNEFINTPAYLGAGEVLNVTDLAIFPTSAEHRFVPEDNDWYRIVAESTGTLDIQVYFEGQNPELLPTGGDLDVAVYDSTGNLIAGTGAFGDNEVTGPAPFDDDERVRMPVVAGQSYYLRVFGADPALTVNGYDMTIINEAPPIPYDIELLDIIVESSVDDAVFAPTTTEFRGDPTSDLSEEDDFYNGKYLTFLMDEPNGDLRNVRVEVVDYVGATRHFTVAPALPQIPLNGYTFQIESFDTGHSQLDDYTRDNTPIVFFRLDDDIYTQDLPGNPVPDSPPDQVIPIPFIGQYTLDVNVDPIVGPPVVAAGEAGFRVPVYIEGAPTQGGIPAPSPQQLIGFARQYEEPTGTVVPGVYVFNFETDAIDYAGNPNGANVALALTDGSHFISAKVQIVTPVVGGAVDFNDDLGPLDDIFLTGLGARSVSHEIVVDTDHPPVVFGDPTVPDDGLHPDSDSGVAGPGNQGTLIDEITNDVTPTFWGRAEANTLVRLYVDVDLNGVLDPTVDVFIGETVAIPLDGTNQFVGGMWQMTSVISMNDQSVFGTPPTGPTVVPPIDGLRRILVVGEDVAGNVSDVPDVLDIFIDTQGPQVTDVYVTADPDYDLFDPKPSTDGPTPMVSELSIDFRDLPHRELGFLYEALAHGGPNGAPSLSPGNFQIVGDHNGIIPIQTITLSDEIVTAAFGTVQAAPTDTVFRGDAGLSAVDDFYNGQRVRFLTGPLMNQVVTITDYVGATREITVAPSFPVAPVAADTFVILPIATATITLGFDDPNTPNYVEALPDDRFTLTISDSLVDPAGNQLDGESNANEPHEETDAVPDTHPDFPSGDGVPGGDFVARFTVDSRPEIGIWATGTAYIDINGNFLFDPQNEDQNQDYTNRDIVFSYAYSSDDLFAGNFAGPGVDGIHGTVDDAWGADGIAGTPDDPTADDFDKLAAYGRVDYAFRWLIDTDNNGVPDAGIPAGTTPDAQGVLSPGIIDPAGINGFPVAGNFNGTPWDEVGVFDGTTWYLDTTGNFMVDTAITSAIIGYPIVGDFDGDGQDDLATWTDDAFRFDLANDGFGDADGMINLGFIGVRERPIAADFNQDGVDDIGLWVPDQTGVTPVAGGEWYFLISDPDVPQVDGSLGKLNHAFEPVPFGNDMFAQFGDEFGLPIVGNFDPPGEGAPGVGDPSVANLAGTESDDLIEVVAGPVGSWTVTINSGTPTVIDAAVTTVSIDGLGGNDTVIFTGTAAAETAELWPDYGRFVGNITVDVSNVESIDAAMGAGYDKVVFHDSAGDDVLTTKAYNSSAVMTGLATGGTLSADDVEEVEAYAEAGGYDSVRMYDSIGNDVYIGGKPVGGTQYSQLTSGDFVADVAGFRSYAESFENGYGIARIGDDTAELYDTPGDDVAQGYLGRRWTAVFEDNDHDYTYDGNEYFNKAKEFDTTTVFASTSIERDVAQLYDRIGDDFFTATPDYAVMEGGGSTIRVEDFGFVHGYAKYGGNDTAGLYDSAGDDRLKAYGDPTIPIAILRNNDVTDPDNNFYSRAKYFDEVIAHALAGGTDEAFFYDSVNTDRFTGRPTYSSLDGPGFDHRAEYFEAVYASSENGGDDTAVLQGSSTYVDHITADLPKADTGHSAQVTAGVGSPLDYMFEVTNFSQADAYGDSADSKDVDASTADWLILYGWGS